MAERRNYQEMNMSATATIRFLAALAVAALTVAILLLGRTDEAAAKSQIFFYSSQPSTTQAGGHPDIVSIFSLGTRFTQGKIPDCGCNDPKDVTLRLPAGVTANPHVASTCLSAEAVTFSCSPDSQVGFIIIRRETYVTVPIYRTVPQSGQAALFMFFPPLPSSIPQYIAFTARTGGDYGLNIKNIGITHVLPFEYFAPTFWGVPADPAHDPLRFEIHEKGINCPQIPLSSLLENEIPSTCTTEATNSFGAPKLVVPSSLPVKPLTQNPTTCAGPLESSLETLAYDREVDSARSTWPETTGCDQLSFDPSLSAKPTTTSTDTASGMDIELTVPQFQDPTTPSPSEIRAATMELPPGFSINPNAADGKTVCTDEQARFGTEEEAECPETSKVGTVRLDSSNLPAPINGGLYLGESKPGDRYRLVITANGFGTAVKLPGSVKADPRTGQLSILQNLPQSPFQEFDLHVFGSERGLLATPDVCGTYPVRTTFTPWATEISQQISTQFFTLDSGPGGAPCHNGSRPFHPSLEAGSENNTAGKHSPFSLRLSRADGEQNFAAVDISTPPGFSATLKGIPYCPDSALGLLSSLGYSGLAERSSPACPASSLVGTVVTGEGAGTRPLYTPGRVYLAGPYKGAPLSLVAGVPAISGPYDLGNVAVRIALNIDPRTAQVTAVSDPLPQILEGIPIRARSLLVSLNRPNFALNPTNCEPFSIESTAFGNEGASSKATVPFQVANCTDLGFAPKLALSVSGGTKRTGNPSLRATLTATNGEANIGRTVVTLPHSEFLDNKHLSGPCTRVQFAANACPAGSVIGRATVVSPLLDEPLAGPVYLKVSNHRLPDLLVDLHGQFHIELAARIDSVNQRLRTTFETVPDVPVSKFTLRLAGGKKGLLENSEDLCAGSHRATVLMDGQNGARSRQSVVLGASCGGESKRKRRHPRAKRTQEHQHGPARAAR